MTPIAAPEPARSNMLTRVAVGVSIAVHLAAVALSLGYAGAGLFTGGEAEAVAVTVVTPEQVAALNSEPPTEPKPEPDPKLDLRLSPVETPSKPEQAQRQPPAPTPKPPSAPVASAASAAPAAPQQPAAMQVPPTSAPSYAAPQADISLRYQVDLGLKEISVVPPSVASATSGASDFDAPATTKADIGTSNVAAFRAHLKECAALPAALNADDKVMIVLRARFTPDGRLAAPPILIEASASAKGPALMQAAIAALQSCQPYAALPADKYVEWRVLDLRFTPQDFRKS